MNTTFTMKFPTMFLFIKLNNIYNINKYYSINIKLMSTTVEINGMIWVEQHLKSCVTHTKPGSLSYLLFGQQPSEQSIFIKFGRFGEYLSKELVKTNPRLELLQCGIQHINGKKKDVDLIFKDEERKIIYYRELKGNIELDTEKIPATITKCDEIRKSLSSIHDGYEINCGILNWSVYNRDILTSGISNIKSFENGGIHIEHMGEFLEIVGVSWSQEDYYAYFRIIGSILRSS